ncbi:MAG: SEC-C domain-containing protein [Betaproteobacteria bacterium]|nr:SEC-C domain-containing protein [Betaproteobacteria bacterium]
MYPEPFSALLQSNSSRHAPQGKMRYFPGTRTASLRRMSSQLSSTPTNRAVQRTADCPCNSRLRYKHCCGSASGLAARGPSHLVRLRQAGLQAQRRGDFRWPSRFTMGSCASMRKTGTLPTCGPPAAISSARWAMRPRRLRRCWRLPRWTAPGSGPISACCSQRYAPIHERCGRGTGSTPTGTPGSMDRSPRRRHGRCRPCPSSCRPTCTHRSGAGIWRPGNRGRGKTSLTLGFPGRASRLP